MGIFVRRLAEYGFTPIQIVCIRVVLAALIFSVIQLVKDPKGFRISLRDIPLFLGLGLGSILFFTVCYFTAISMMTLSTAAILLYTSPIWIMLMSHRLHPDEPSGGYGCEMRCRPVAAWSMGLRSVDGLGDGSHSIPRLHARPTQATALGIVAKELEKNGIEAEIAHVGNKNIRGCIACFKCQQTGRCVFDDMVNELAPKFEEADALVVGSPVYYAGMAGTMNSFLDRLFFSTPFSKRMKVGAAVSSARRAGTTATFDQLNKYFTISEMPVASGRYWNMVHGYSMEDVMRDEEGVQNLRILARNIAFLVKAIAAEKERNGLPEKEEIVFTNFIR